MNAIKTVLAWAAVIAGVVLFSILLWDMWGWFIRAHACGCS